MPVPSGSWRLRVAADGYMQVESPLHLDPTPVAAATVTLRPAK